MAVFEMVCVGDELLDGRIRDANALGLGDLLFGTASTLRRVEIVADDVGEIVEALRRTTAEYVVVSGGLGPTEDDLTRDAAAAFLGVELVLDHEALERIRQRFEMRNYTFTENNARQAHFPVGADVLRTDIGTAAGFRVETESQTFFFFPGVPREFAWYCERHIAPLAGSQEAIATRNLFFHGLGESAMETKVIGPMKSARERGVVVGFRADYPVVELKLVGPPDAVCDAADAAEEALGAWLVGVDDENLSQRVGRLLLERGATVTTAESCTAGGLASMITDSAGSSGWFQRGFVTYSNDVKSEVLGVRDDILLKHGAVSPQTVAQMAAGARDRSRATFALAVSGIAGPGGGTQKKPVGTVHFGLATPRGVFHRHVRYRLPNRQLIRAGSVWTALSMLLWYLEERIDEHSVNGPFSEEEVWSNDGIAVEEVYESADNPETK